VWHVKGGEEGKDKAFTPYLYLLNKTVAEPPLSCARADRKAYRTFSALQDPDMGSQGVRECDSGVSEVRRAGQDGQSCRNARGNDGRYR